jgi:hypothetical protein
MHETLSSQPARVTEAAANTFDGTYLRPNRGSSGTVPASPPFCDSPDIWIAGTSAVPNFRKALAKRASYTQQSPNTLTVKQTNYIYVRGKNGAATSQSNTVKLYYAPSSVIPWPGEWVDNVITTDQGNGTALISNLAPGAVGVADQPFVWKTVPPVPSGSDHYCLFAQLNNDRNQNPFPEVYTQIDMAALLKNNLAWGWRNTRLVQGEKVDASYNQMLTVPDDITPGTTRYLVYLIPRGFIGWTVWFTASRADAKGRPIEIKPTAVNQDDQIIGRAFTLKPGFNAVVTVYLKSNNQKAKPGATMPFTSSYETAGPEAEEAVRRGLVHHELNNRLRASVADVGGGPLIVLGSNHYTYVG